MSKEPVDNFSGEYRFLSNFLPCRVEFMGLVFFSSEAAYQAAKCEDPKDREQFRSMEAGQAKRAGRAVKYRRDWEAVKVDVMRVIVREKFKHEGLAEKLLSTGTRKPVEGNDWGDQFWGVCKGEGKNWLGKILMETRTELRKARKL